MFLIAFRLKFAYLTQCQRDEKIENGNYNYKVYGVLGLGLVHQPSSISAYFLLLSAS